MELGCRYMAACRRGNSFGQANCGIKPYERIMYDKNYPGSYGGKLTNLFMIMRVYAPPPGCGGHAPAMGHG